MRALLLYNPIATTTSSGVTDVIRRALASELDVDAVPTKRRNHAGFLAAGAAAEGYGMVVVLGGDGTVNEVVQGIATTDVALAIIPGGSTNVLARSLGLPNDAVAATGMILRRLAEGRVRRINLGMANDRYFTFHAGFGWDAEVVRQVERRYQLKKAVRQASFAWCSLTAYVRSATVRRARITARSHGETVLRDKRWVVACNTSPYTYIGRHAAHLCPAADVARDLSLVGMSRVTLDALLRLTRTALTPEGVGALRFVDVASDLDEVVCRSDRSLPLQLDGDYVGDTSVLTLRSVREALSVVA